MKKKSLKYNQKSLVVLLVLVLLMLLVVAWIVMQNTKKAGKVAPSPSGTG